MRRLPLLLSLCFALAPSVPAAAATPLITDARQLTFEGRRAGEGYFSADGKRMIFQSERAKGNPFYQIYVLDLVTGDVDMLSTGVGKTTCGWIHPSGERALFASTQFDPDAETKMQAELEFRASGETRRYSWDYDPTYDIVTTDLDEGGYTRLTDARGYDAEGAYSPDGERIVFASNRVAYAADLSAEEEERLERDPAFFMDLYVMDADGSNVRRLTDAPGYDGGPFWSADGEQIVWRRFSEDGARAEIYTMNADGTGERRITELGVLSWAPFFHPSGKYIVFSTNLQGFANFELYLVDAAGEKEPVRVTEREGFDGLATFAPDGETISWTSNATPEDQSQIFIGDWDHAAALELIAAAPARTKQAAAPLEGTEAAVTPADLKHHVEALTDPAMEGRLTGTEGARRATAYVAKAFEGLGLEPAGQEGTMFQPFGFTAGVDLGEGNRLTVSVDGEPEDLAVDDDWRPLAFSRTGAFEETGVTFAGYGIVASAAGDAPALDSYAEIDVDGRWVLIWRGMPADLTSEERTALSRFADLRYKASVAKSKGAAGVLVAPPSRESFEDSLPALTFEAISGEAGLPVVAVDRAAAASMLNILGDDLAPMTERLEAGEAAGRALVGVSVEGAVDLDFEERTGRNVLARLDLDGVEGGAAPVVVGAHVDHLGRGETSGSLARGEQKGKVHPGADDNASGVAAVLEVAQKLAADHGAGELDGTRDVIFAAWSGEELGLLGASHYVEVTAARAGADDLGDVVAAYINLDMVGRLDDRLIVSGLGSSDVWAREVERRNAVVGLPIRTSQDTYMPTDATAFYTASVPILSLFTGAHEDYHRPADTADKLNYEGLADIARFTALVTRSRTLAADAPAYIEVARPEPSGGRSMSNVFLGTIPDYAEEGTTGVPLSGVVNGGPAAEAGLEGGDVVVGLAGAELANIYDYVRALNGLQPGEPTTITVRRNGEERTLDITPGVRE